MERADTPLASILQLKCAINTGTPDVVKCAAPATSDRLPPLEAAVLSVDELRHTSFQQSLCRLNSALTPLCRHCHPRYSALSHPVTEHSRQGGRVELALDCKRPLPNQDFVLGYRVWQNSIVASVNVQAAAPGATDARSNFVLSVSPPAPEHTQVRGRRTLACLQHEGCERPRELGFGCRSVCRSLSADSHGELVYCGRTVRHLVGL